MHSHVLWEQMGFSHILPDHTRISCPLMRTHPSILGIFLSHAVCGSPHFFLIDMVFLTKQHIFFYIMILVYVLPKWNYLAKGLTSFALFTSS